jgi:hypothetical protein
MPPEIGIGSQHSARCAEDVLAFSRGVRYKVALAVKSELLKWTALAACVALSSPFVFAWGENATFRIIETQTMFIRHTATEYQRRVAEQNAKAFFKQLPPATKAELKKKKVKAVLIRTVRSKQTSPQAKEVRMRYDLQEESLIDDSAYEFTTPLASGTIAKVQGLEPEYVGP